MRTKIVRIIWSSPQPIEAVIDSLSGNEIGLYYITRKYNGQEKVYILGKA